MWYRYMWIALYNKASLAAWSIFLNLPVRKQSFPIQLDRYKMQLLVRNFMMTYSAVHL